MPFANPDASFDVAARHLFRHLEEPGRLRRNPLVRRFFEDAGGRMTRARAKAALALIMRIVEEGAEVVRASDIDAKEDERAYRQHTIFRRTYVERAPIEQIASELGLSIRQYYRERSAICMRVARYVEAFDARNAAATPYARLDPLRFQMERAAQYVELGDAAAATRVYEQVLAAAEPAATKIEALCRLAEIAAEDGAGGEAQVRLEEARAMLLSDAYEMPPLARAATRCHVALVRSRAAWHAGAAHDAAAALAEAHEIAATLLPNGGKRVRELVIEVLLERTGRKAGFGDFDGAFADVAEANDVQRSVPDPSLRQRSDLARWHALLAMTSPEPSATPDQSFAPLCEALELARACGSARRAILATGTLCVQASYARNDRAVLDTARRVSTMAEHVQARRFRGAVAVSAAATLLTTQYWKRGVRIAAAAAENLATGSFEWVKQQLLQAEYSLRCGRKLESHLCAVAAERSARAFGSPWLESAALRTLAHSALALGHSCEARAFIDEAYAAVEKYDAALSRSCAHRIAEMTA